MNIHSSSTQISDLIVFWYDSIHPLTSLPAVPAHILTRDNENGRIEYAWSGQSKSVLLWRLLSCTFSSNTGMLRKGEETLVRVEEAMNNMVVVSIKVGERTLRGVLLDSDRFDTHFYYPKTVYVSVYCLRTRRSMQVEWEGNQTKTRKANRIDYFRYKQ